MKNEATTEQPEQGLPSFLDDGTTGAAAPADGLEVPAGKPAEAPADPGAEPGADTPAADAAAPPRAGRRPAQRHRPAPQRRRRGAATAAAGFAVLLGGLALGAAPHGAASAWAERVGATPGNLVVLGAVLAGVGATRRRQACLEDLVDAHAERAGAGADALREHLSSLATAQPPGRAEAPQGEELQHLLIAVQRQDDKLNNLTKAIKMYGKPLMEISEQGAELGAAVAALAGRTGAAGALEPLQQQVARVEVAVQAIAQRLEDSEVRRCLLRLEDAAQQARDDVQTLLRGDSIARAAEQLQRHVDQTTARLAEGLSRLREGNLGGIESAVRDIQREVSGVATAVAQIQASVQKGVARPATAAAPASDAPTAAAPPPAPGAQAAQPSRPADGKAGAAYATGTLSTSGKNVLGAIARLKQMKS